MANDVDRRTRAIVVFDDTADDDQLKAMDKLGVRGVRVNLASHGAQSKDHAAEIIEAVGRRIAHLGWHIQLYTALSVIAENAAVLRRLPVDLVLDHMGRPDAKAGIEQAGTKCLN